MATPRALPGVVQMIDHNRNFNFSVTKSFLEELRQYSSASSDYTVISIMGQPCSGKSTLLNFLFGTRFVVPPLLPRMRTNMNKGIWIARCIDPCMIIIDIDAFDGMGGGEAELERPSVRYALTVSNVVLLNIWFHDSYRTQGESARLMKFIIEESVKIDALQKRTKVIVCVRDYQYDLCPPDILKKEVEMYMNKLWDAVHPVATNKKMSDCMELIVKDFPLKHLHYVEFAEKSIDLVRLLCSFAGNRNLHKNYIAIRLKMKWIACCYKRERGVDVKEMSIYLCCEKTDKTLNYLDKVTGYGPLMSGTFSLEEFNAKLLLFLRRVKSRYEEETRTFDMDIDTDIRDELKVELEKRIVEIFKPTFVDKVASLHEALCSKALSNLADQLDKIEEQEESAIIQLLQNNYIKEFDEISRTDLHPYNGEILNRQRDKLLMHLVKMVEQERQKIQLKEIEESLHEETKKRNEVEQQLANEKVAVQNFQKTEQKMLEEIDGLRKQNTELQNERDKFPKIIEESLHVETKKRMEAEQQLANEKTMLQNIQKSKEKMLEEIEGLQKQNVELQNERDKIVRKLEDFRLWMAGIASSSNRPNNNFTEFTYLELKKGTNDFHDSFIIGEGGFSTVYKGFLRDTTVAIKVLKQQSRHEDNDFSHEVEILRGVRHPNLVVQIGVCPEAHALVFEFMLNGNLKDLLKKRPKSLSWKTRICIASNICSGLIFLHSVYPHGIVHGDLKPANILLDSNYIGKLSDFGISRHLSQTDTKITPHHQTEFPKGTRPYMDPEYFQSAESTPQCDVYSFGIVLLELVSGKDPWGLRKSMDDAIQKGELKKFVDPSAGKWPFEEAKKMVLLGLRCSELSRKNRPDLVKEVWYEIELMKHVALSH